MEMFLIMRIKPFVASVSAVLLGVAGISNAIAGNDFERVAEPLSSKSFYNEESFLKIYGQAAEEIAPSVYSVSVGGQEIRASFGDEGMRYELDVMQQELELLTRTLEKSTSKRSADEVNRKIAWLEQAISDASSSSAEKSYPEYYCGGYFYIDSFAGLYGSIWKGNAGATVQYWEGGPPSSYSKTVTAYAQVVDNATGLYLDYDEDSMVAYGNDGATISVYAMGGPVQCFTASSQVNVARAINRNGGPRCYDPRILVTTTFNRCP